MAKRTWRRGGDSAKHSLAGGNQSPKIPAVLVQFANVRSKKVTIPDQAEVAAAES